MTFGAKLKQLRTERGLSQADLTGPGVSRSLVSLLENDRIMPTPQAMETLANRLGVSYLMLKDADPGPIERTVRLLVRESGLLVEDAQFTKARELSSQAVELSESYGDLALLTEARLIAGWAAMATGDPEKGMGDIVRASSRSISTMGTVDSPKLLGALAMACFYQDVYPMAQAYFEAILEVVSPRTPQRGNALLHLGIVRQSRFGWPHGREEFVAAMELGQTIGERHIEAWGLQGVMSADIDSGINPAKETWRRLESITQLSDSATREISVALLRAQLARHQGRHQEAIRQLTTLAQNSPSYSIHYEVSRNAIHLEDYDQALRAVDRGMDHVPTVRRAYAKSRLLMAKAFICQQIGRTAEAFAIMEALEPTLEVTGLARQLNQLGQWRQQWLVR